MERKTEANRMQFHFVTGTCKNCGGNKFRFDPKEQTFVCEYCQTEVYAVSPLNGQKEEPADDKGDGDGASVEPIKEEKEEKTVYSGYCDSSSPASIFLSVIAGMIMVFLRPILYETGFLEKMLSNAEASVESSEGVTPALTRASEIMETMIKGIGSDSFLTFSAVFGSVIIVMSMIKVVKYVMRGY